MATPTFLRYLPARLRPLGAPAIWVPLTVFTLLSLLIWEWYKNPDWRNRSQADNSSVPGLTSEEEAQLSEIDTLDVLLNGSRLPSSALLQNGAAPGNLPLSGAAVTNPDSTAEVTQSRDLAGRENPFGAYEEQYRFSAGSTSPSAAASLPAGGLNSGAQAKDSSALPNGGALSEALNRQQSNRTTAAQPSQTTTAGATPTVNSQSSGFPGFSDSAAVSPAPAAGGISAPYIRTTTDMSPPPGTTGYQVPASSSLPVFNVAPQQPGQNPVQNSSQNPYLINSQSFSQPQTTAPLPNATTAGSYTVPSFTQPAQNQQVP